MSDLICCICDDVIEPHEGRTEISDGADTWPVHVDCVDDDE